jgi:hypothetical protein
VTAWRKIDQYGAFAGTFHGTYDALRSFLLDGGDRDRELWDVAKVTKRDNERVYLCDPQLLIECTVVKLTTPWGDERYIPEEFIPQ